MSTTWRRLLAGTLTATLPAAVAAQQATTVSGVVMSDANTPVNGASVTIPTLAIGAVTNAEGRYTFVVPAAKAVGTVNVTVRRLGYAPSTAAVTLGSGAVTQNFALTQTASQLTGVVVTALSQQREKQTIGTSQQQIGGEELTRTKTPSLVSSMSGKAWKSWPRWSPPTLNTRPTPQACRGRLELLQCVQASCWPPPSTRK